MKIWGKIYNIEEKTRNTIEKREILVF